jgi:hypothetical protein
VYFKILKYLVMLNIFVAILVFRYVCIWFIFMHYIMQFSHPWPIFFPFSLQLYYTSTNSLW